nr:hypothetical protein [uncultured Niameybacter sp.]
MNEEMMRILKMVEEGKITADKAKELMEVMQATIQPMTTTATTTNYEDKFLRVKVLSSEGDKVNVQLPIKIIKEVMKVSGKLPIDMKGMQGVDIESLMNTIVSCLDNEMMGEIVNVESASGDTVKVYIE